MKNKKSKILGLCFLVLLIISAANFVFKLVWKGSTANRYLESPYVGIIVFASIIMTIICAVYIRLLYKSADQKYISPKIRLLAWIYYYILIFGILIHTFRLGILIFFLLHNGFYNYVNISQLVHYGIGVTLFLLWFMFESNRIDYFRSRVAWLYIQGTNAHFDKDFKTARQCWKDIISLDPHNWSVFYSWGLDFAVDAEGKNRQEADKLLRMACEKFEKALAIHPDTYVILNDWGHALADLAFKKELQEADKLFDEAYEKFDAAVAINPDTPGAFCNWGCVLELQARTKSEDKANLLYEKAGEKYEKALNIDPDIRMALYNLGSVFANLARSKNADEADELYKKVCEQCEKILTIKPDDVDSLCNLALTLLDRAKINTGHRHEELLNQARDKFLDAEELEKGVGAYNLACLYAIRGDDSECEKWLKVGEGTNKLFTREYAMNDEDFINVCDKEWFRNIRWTDEEGNTGLEG